MKKNKVGAIIVLYNPAINDVFVSLNSLLPQVEEVCIIDNTPGQDLKSEFINISNVNYIPLKQNLGIAKAQNIGIQYFAKKEFDFLLFCDQDSIITTDLVINLIQDFYRLKQMGINIGAIGPLPINKHTGDPYNKYNIKEIINDGDVFFEKQSIISSGSLIPISYFRDIGLYNEEFFIDFVDNEWFFRLKNITGASSYISTRLKLQHELGIYKKFLWFNISISSPFRIYYQIRNFLWMRKINYVPIEWKKQTFDKFLLKLIYYPLFPKNRFDYIKQIYKGFRDGLK